MLKRGQRVVDLGCWPGGWLQIAAAKVGEGGRVVGIDVAAIDPPLGLAQVATLEGDLEAPEAAARILDALGAPADVLLSDAAPKLTGIRAADGAAEERLLEAIEALIPRLLRPRGDLLLKILEGAEAAAVDKRIRQQFEKAKTVKTEATRKGSRERYLLARGYKGAPDPSAE